LNEALRNRLDRLSGRLEELNGLLASESAARDLDQLRKLSREHAELTALVDLYGRYRQAERDAVLQGLLARPADLLGLLERRLCRHFGLSPEELVAGDGPERARRRIRG